MTKTPIDPKRFVESGAHLPQPLKDFHDQKDLFKLLHRTYGHETGGQFDKRGDHVNWVLGQCYVIDWFLWFMAQRGWTLQRSRSNVEFRDLRNEIEEMKNADAAKFAEFLKQRHSEMKPDSA